MSVIDTANMPVYQRDRVRLINLLEKLPELIRVIHAAMPRMFATGSSLVLQYPSQDAEDWDQTNPNVWSHLRLIEYSVGSGTRQVLLRSDGVLTRKVGGGMISGTWTIPLEISQLSPELVKAIILRVQQIELKP